MLATTLVARGSMAACQAGGTCCVPATAPTTKPADDCCQAGGGSKPTTLPAQASLGGEMPCCASVLWSPAVGVASSDADVVSPHEVAPPDVLRSAAAVEPTTPPPRPIA